MSVEQQSSSIAFPQFHGKPVLVTGGCGFIGSHLVEALVDLDARVTVVDNMQAGRWENLDAIEKGVRRVEGDVRDVAMMEQIVAETQPRFVFHLAANASVPGSVQEPVYDFETNCAGSFVLLEALRSAGTAAKIVVASSGAVYGEPVRFPISEDDALAPISPYGASKLAMEIEARMFHRVYQQSVVIARLFNCYGPRMARFVILDFLRKLQRDPNVLEVLGTGQQIRDFTYVSDTVQGLLLLAVHGEDGHAYNVSSGVTHSVTELANKLIVASGLAGQTEIRYTGKSWVGDAQHWEVSINKLCALGYFPGVTLECGLENIINWFRQQPLP
jgi:UDP-glucose 4-epimerase